MSNVVEFKPRALRRYPVVVVDHDRSDSAEGLLAVLARMQKDIGACLCQASGTKGLFHTLTRIQIDVAVCLVEAKRLDEELDRSV